MTSESDTTPPPEPPADTGRCRQGHHYSPAELRYPVGYRTCATCTANNAWRAK